jgi:hypothetical protein
MFVFCYKMQTRRGKIGSVDLEKTTGWMAGVRFQAWQDFSVLHSVQTDSGAHLVCSPMGTEGTIPGGKAIGA